MAVMRYTMNKKTTLPATILSVVGNIEVTAALLEMLQNLKEAQSATQCPRSPATELCIIFTT